MGMKISEAFRLLEEGKILTNKSYGIRFDTKGMLEYALSPDFRNWYSWDISLAGINFFSEYYVYERPVEKVQYYQAIFSINGEIRYWVGELFKDKEDFEKRKSNSQAKLIQLIPFGTPV